MAERVVFDQLFETLADGQITPRLWVQIDGLKFGPGSKFGPDFRPGHRDLNDWRGCKIWGHREGKVFVVELVSVT